MLTAIVVLHNLKIYQMDIKIAFLNGKLNENICMENCLWTKKMCKDYLCIKKSVRLLNYFMNQSSMLQK